MLGAPTIRAIFPPLHRLLHEGDDVLCVASKGEDLPCPVAGNVEIKGEQSPSVIEVGRRPKLSANFPERFECFDAVALGVPPLLLELEHFPSPAATTPQTHGKRTIPVAEPSLRSCEGQGFSTPQSLRAATCYRPRASADDLLFDNDLATKRETLREPAKRWRNKWRADAAIIVQYEDSRIGEVERGEEFFAAGTYPSRDLAETAAAKHDGWHAGWPVKYLGAFPCDENGEPLP